MKINLELLVAELVVKLRRGEIDPHGPNLEDDLRGVIRLHEVKDANWHTEKREG